MARTIKGLVLWQPWATLLAIGAKKIETRSWASEYSGPVAICAAKRFPREAKELCMGEPFMGALMGAGYSGTSELPRGCVVAVGNLHLTGQIIIPGNGDVLVRGQELPVEGDELEYGDYRAGRYGWVFSNVTRLDPPLSCIGARGLFDLTWPAFASGGPAWWFGGGKRQPVYRGRT